MVNAYNTAQVSLVIDQVAPRLLPGDQVALVNGNGGHPLDLEQLREWVSNLQPHLGAGVSVSHHTSGLANVQQSASTAPTECTSLIYDYEPNFESEFSWDFPSTLDRFEKFVAISHQAHRQAVGYPTGRALLETDLLPYRWDYGRLRVTVDRLVVQTQHWAHLGVDAWNRAVSTLQTQFRAHGVGMDQIVAQVSIGSGPNAVDGSAARTFLEDATQRGMGGLYIWWSPDAISDLLRLLG